MKRSEMLDIISNDIYKATKHEYSEIITTSILQKIEEAGMEPPYMGPDKMDLGDGLFVIMNYKWEKE